MYSDYLSVSWSRDVPYISCRNKEPSVSTEFVISRNLRNTIIIIIIIPLQGTIIQTIPAATPTRKKKARLPATPVIPLRLLSLHSKVIISCIHHFFPSFFFIFIHFHFYFCNFSLFWQNFVSPCVWNCLPIRK